MRKFIGIAASLALVASGAAAAAASLGQDATTGTPRVRVSTEAGKPELAGGDLAVDDDELKGLGQKVRQLAVLAGRGAQLGVSVRDLDAGQAKSRSGVVVEDVREDSAASKAGIRKGDLITGFDGERVRGVRHLTRLVAETPDGRTVTASLERDGKRVDVSVTPESGSRASFDGDFDVLVPPMQFEHVPGMEFEPLPEMEKGRRWAPKVPEGTWSFERRPGDVWAFRTEKGRLGVRIQSLDGQLGEYFGTKSGVLVNAVDADSPAARSGLKAGDVVTAINGTAVAEPSELVAAVRAAENGTTLTVDYVRDRKAATAQVTLPKDEPGESPKTRQRVSPI